MRSYFAFFVRDLDKTCSFYKAIGAEHVADTGKSRVGALFDVWGARIIFYQMGSKLKIGSEDFCKFRSLLSEFSFLNISVDSLPAISEAAKAYPDQVKIEYLEDDKQLELEDFDGLQLRFFDHINQVN